MKTYLTYAPLALILVWVFLAANWYKSQKEFQNQSGVNPFSPIDAFRFFFSSNKNEIERSAYQNLKQRSANHMKIWIVSIVIFIIVTIIVGIATAKSNNTDNPGKSNSLGDTLTRKLINIDSNVIKVYIDGTGVISANGRPITLALLDSSFNKLKSIHGIVYYSRDNSSQTPPPGAMDVMELITKYGLPVKLFSDKTFSHLEQFD